MTPLTPINDVDHLPLWRFNFQGRFLGFVDRELGKRQYLQMDMLGEPLQIQLPRELRVFAEVHLQPGDSIQVSGVGKLDQRTGRFKLKAHQIMTVATAPRGQQPLLAPKSRLHRRSKAKVLLCQKTDCFKQGGKSGLNIENPMRELASQLSCHWRDRCHLSKSLSCFPDAIGTGGCI